MFQTDARGKPIVRLQRHCPLRLALLVPLRMAPKRDRQQELQAAREKKVAEARALVEKRMNCKSKKAMPGRKGRLEGNS